MGDRFVQPISGPSEPSLEYAREGTTEKLAAAEKELLILRARDIGWSLEVKELRGALKEIAELKLKTMPQRVRDIAECALHGINHRE